MPEVALGGHICVAGDGSTAFTGSRPKRPRSGCLPSAQKLPEYGVFSRGGAGEAYSASVRHRGEGCGEGGGGGVWGWVGRPTRP